MSLVLGWFVVMELAIFWRRTVLPVRGGATRRPGTYYVADVGDHARKVRLVPFEFSVTQAYMLEFGHQYIHFYMDKGQIQEVDSYTKLLLHCDGDDASQVFTDDGYTEHTITTAGTAQIDDEYKKFGSGSGWFDGNSDYVYAADHADWYFDGPRFTIDFWVRLYAAEGFLPPAYSGMFQLRQDATHFMAYYLDNDGKIYFELKEGATTFKKEAGVKANFLNTWVHVAIIRGWGDDDDDWAVCINGAAVATWTSNVSVSDWTAAFEVGRHYNDTQAAYKYHPGWIEEFRVSKGIARWTADFTPPSVAYPLSGGASAYEITSPYLEVDLPALKFAQSADVLYITHPSHAPRKLSRTGHTAWTLTEIDFQDGPYEDEVTAVLSTTAASGQATIALKVICFLRNGPHLTVEHPARLHPELD